MNGLRLVFVLVLGLAAGAAALAAGRVSASGPALHPASACPTLVHRAARTPSPVLRDFARQVRALFDSPHGAYRGYEIEAVLPLTGTLPDPPAVNRARFERLAAAACGADTAHRSWVVVVWFPNSRAVTVGQQVYWLAPTRAGWQVWWDWNPQPGWARAGSFPNR